jgi:hypothetical protein
MSRSQDEAREAVASPDALDALGPAGAVGDLDAAGAVGDLDAADAADALAAGTDEPALDPTAALAIITAQRARARDTVTPDGRVIFLAWAASWILGYGVMWSTSRDGGVPPGWAGALFGLLIIGSIVTTIVHSVRRQSGIVGPSRAVSAMYGWSWCVAFVAGQAMVGALGRAGVSDEILMVAANGVSALIVGILYMAGGALWNDRAQFALGVWMALVAGIAAFAGLPGSYAVMGIAGGGGFLVGALLDHLSRRRSGALRRRFG